MPKLHDDDKVVYKRYSNGACVMDRVCRECKKKFVGQRNICPACWNWKYKKKGKFDKRYHRKYYRKNLSKAAITRNKGNLKVNRERKNYKQAAFEKQQKRIEEEMEAIRKAGLDPINDSILAIERAGVVLEKCRISNNDSLFKKAV